MMYCYDFEIAQLLIRVNSPYELTEQFELTAFRVPYNADRKPDALYAIRTLPADWEMKGDKLAQEAHSVIYGWQNEWHRYFYWNVFSEDRYVLLTSRQDSTAEQIIYLQENTLQRILPQFRLSAFLAPEQLLLQHQAFLLHASVINWNGKGILFTGPSGIGKSTQAQLWSQLEESQIINGDRAIIRQHHNGFWVWGSPYAGTSGIYRNCGVPIAAIVVLSQAQKDAIHPLGGIAAFQSLLQETTTIPWSSVQMSKLTDLILRVAEQIPIYHLACTPTAAAVDTLKQALTE